MLHRILPMYVPAVDPAWQLKVNPVPARLRELLSIQPFFKLAADHGVNSSNCPHGYRVDDLLMFSNVAFSSKPLCPLAKSK